MDAESTTAQKIAHAAMAFEQRRTGRRPESVTVVLCGNTLVITLNGALSPAERALIKIPEGAAKVKDFHRQLFACAADSLMEQIKEITGAEVYKGVAEVEPTDGTFVQAFSTGTVVQVFLLAHSVPNETWSGSSALPDSK